MRATLVTLAITALLASVASAQVPLGYYDCYRTPTPITPDGVLDEPAWQHAPWTGLLRMDDGTPGAAYPTTAWMLWDDQNLYVAFVCVDTDMYATFTQHDDPLYTQDVVEVFIMDQASTQGYYLEYEVSPRGTLFDIYITHPSPGIQGDLSWTSGFEAAVVIEGTLDDPNDLDTGYTVEMAIPFSDMYANPGDHPDHGEMIRANLYRIDYTTPATIGGTGANAQLIAWSPTLVGRFHTPDRFGELTFLMEMPPGYRIGGDADLDGDVDLDDFVILKQNFSTGSTWTEGDFDEDGDVDLDDFVILKQNFGG